MNRHYGDKIALVHIEDRKVLLALNKGSDKWYLPGGQREPGETDEETLIREVKEELNVDIIPETANYHDVLEAQGHGAPEGKMTRVTCYTASFLGELKASSEIARIAFFSYSQKDLTSAPTQLLLNNLKTKDVID